MWTVNDVDEIDLYGMRILGTHPRAHSDRNRGPRYHKRRQQSGDQESLPQGLSSLAQSAYPSQKPRLYILDRPH